MWLEFFLMGLADGMAAVLIALLVYWQLRSAPQAVLTLLPLALALRGSWWRPRRFRQRRAEIGRHEGKCRAGIADTPVYLRDVATVERGYKAHVAMDASGSPLQLARDVDLPGLDGQR